MTTNYKIYAALAEEEGEGWVWFTQPVFPPRTVVKMSNPTNGLTVFCLSRQLDENFLERYNNSPRVKIKDQGSALVISAWYRDALGGITTSKKDHDHEVNLNVVKASVPVWRDVRAACHHPDLIARIGTRLGVLSAWLGMVALLPAPLELLGMRKCFEAIVLLASSIALAIVGCLAASGVNSRQSGH